MIGNQSFEKPQSDIRSSSVVMLPYGTVSHYDTFSLIESWLVENFGKGGTQRNRRWFYRVVDGCMYYDRETGKYFFIKDRSLRYYLIGDRGHLTSVLSQRINLYFKHQADETAFRLRWEGIMNEVVECHPTRS